jgi:hemolysin activation/secretion protein
MMLDCGSSGLDTEVLPVTLGYSGNILDAGMMIDFGVSVSQNLSGSGQYQFDAVLPDRGAKREFTIERANASVFSTFGKSDWQWRVAVQGQWTDTALLAGEQIGLAGGSSLRGLSERQLSADKGWAGVVEVYSPDLSAWYGKEYGGLRWVAFWDHVSGENVRVSGDSVAFLEANSVGLGVRYTLGKNVMIKADYGRAISIDATAANGKNSPLEAYQDTDRMHVSLMMKF